MPKIFRAEVRCAFPEWGRYSLYMTAVCFDSKGEMTGYVDLPDQASELETPPCESADLYLYVVAREFPASDLIAASPPFEIELLTRAGDASSESTFYFVNQWGGLSAKRSLV